MGCIYQRHLGEIYEMNLVISCAKVCNKLVVKFVLFCWGMSHRVHLNLNSELLQKTKRGSFNRNGLNTNRYPILLQQSLDLWMFQTHVAYILLFPLAHDKNLAGPSITEPRYVS